ncbi:MAG: TIGR01777 family oxidoreductase [Bacteroidales bacterium]|nr:TIGR01777 family oxidoreductase [Bacteroidales bacterium]
MKICIFGGTGFIGRRLAERLCSDGLEVLVFSRSAAEPHPGSGHPKIIQWSGHDWKPLPDYFSGKYSIINLAGDNIGSGLWWKSKKKRILDSRIHTTEMIREACLHSGSFPACIIQGSATGYYGSSDDELTEKSPKGNGFLAEVTDRWEGVFKKNDMPSVRILFIRTGLVLGRESGLLPRMITPTRFFLGGYPGNGKQYLPWIHIEDEVEAIRFLLTHDQTEGVYNLCAPAPVSFREFCRCLAQIMNRPCRLIIPSFVLNALPGNMGRELFLSSQKVIPERLLEAGYSFTYNQVGKALEQLIKNPDQ